MLPKDRGAWWLQETVSPDQLRKDSFSAMLRIRGLEGRPENSCLFLEVNPDSLGLAHPDRLWKASLPRS